RATSELEEMRKRARGRDQRIAELEKQLAVPQVPVLELQKREQRIAELEKQLAVPQVPVLELQKREERIALLEGERQGLDWRVQELEGRFSASEYKWEGIVQDLEERLRSREQSFEETRLAADKHRAEMVARDEAGAEQVAAVLELEEEL